MITNNKENAEGVIANLSKTVANQAEAIADLTKQLSKVEIQRKKDQLAFEMENMRADKLYDFITSVGIDPDAVENGYWLTNAAKLIDVSIDEENAEKRLGDVPSGIRAQILASANAIVFRP